MAMKIRLARGGSKKRPFYRVVAADSRMPRDGRYIEKLGTYNPLLPKDDEARINLDIERIKHWLSVGAIPTDRVRRFLETAEVMEKTVRNNPKKALIGKKAEARIAEKAEAEKVAKEEAAKPKPAPEPVVEEPVAEPVVEEPVAEAPAEASTSRNPCRS